MRSEHFAAYLCRIWISHKYGVATFFLIEIKCGENAKKNVNPVGFRGEYCADGLGLLQYVGVTFRYF